MSKRRPASALWSMLLLVALLTAALPAPAFSQAPADTPPPAGAIRLPADSGLPEGMTMPPAPPDADAPEAPAAPSNPAAEADALLPTACSAPAVIPFGRDLELTVGPLNSANNYSAQSAIQNAAWRSTSQSTYNLYSTQASTTCLGTSPGREQVYLYEHSSYGGNCRALNVGRYPNSGDLGIGNDKLTSLKVGANAEIMLCEHGDYGGVCETFTSSDSNLGDNAIGNDRTSSAKVWLAPHAYSVAAIPMGSDNVQIFFKTGSSSGDLVTQRRTIGGGWSDLTYLGLSDTSDPAVVARSPQNYSVVARKGSAIKAMHGDASGPSLIWQDVPGGYDEFGYTTAITDAVGNPAAVSTGPYQMTIFYRTSAGQIKFSEWQSGYGWRSWPISLDKPTATALSVDPVAVSRDPEHIAVFVVVDGRLYVKEWSTANASDWSDTTWTALTNTGTLSVQAASPAVASRHSAHVGVAMLNTAYQIWYMEWTASETAAGWSTPVALDGYVFRPGLVATGGDSMVLYGANASGVYNTGNLYTRQWTQAGGWQAWTQHDSGWYGTQLTAVSFRPHDLLVIGRPSNYRLQAKLYSTYSQQATVSTLASNLNGTPRSQAIATVNARTFWVSVYRGSDGKWYLNARNTTTWTGQTLQLSLHTNADTATGKVSVAAADLDRDGKDEIVVATLNSDGSAGKLGVYKLTVSSTGAVTGISSLLSSASTFSLSGSTFRDINVAVGNLANSTGSSGVADEIVVAAIRNGYAQARVAVYRYAAGALTGLSAQTLDLSSYSLSDLELTIAQVYNESVERTFLFSMATPSFFQSVYRLRQYLWRSSGGLTEDTIGTVDVPAPPNNYVYPIALASGDIDSDGLEEVIYTTGFDLQVYPDPIRAPANAGASSSLAVGDINMDGLADVVYSNERQATTIYSISYLSATKNLIPVGNASAAGVPLLADLDGDSLVATYQGCSEFKEVRVISVGNGQPQWYSSGPTPTTYQYSEGRLFNTDTVIKGDEKAWTTSFGGSLTVGFEQEISFIVKLGSVSSSVSLEVMGSVGQGSTREESEATLSGGSFEGESVTGVVCYAQTGYTCYAYEVAKPGSSATTTAMACTTRPLTVAAQECDSLNDWYSQTFRNAAGDSWASIGHHPPNTTTHSLDLGIPGNYRIPTGSGQVAPPVDPYLVWWDGWDSRMNVSSTTTQGESWQDWEIQRESAVGTTEHYGYDVNLTQSSGVNLAGVILERSLTVGAGQEWNSSVTWSSGLGFGGAVYDYAEDCPFCVPYTVAPFVYRAQAVTLAGERYPYLEQDYYLAAYDTLNQALGAAPARASVNAASVPPQAPLVSSPTHPDPDTWYAGDAVTFDWQQPAGDTAPIKGYRWDLNAFPVFTPTAATRLTTTTTYDGLPDGTYYLHIQAVGDGVARGPIVHRQVRVDNGAPQVAFVTDPQQPDGFDGWFVSPVDLSLESTDPDGSGVSSLEYSTDGSLWQPYAAALPYSADTAGTTLWARATDGVGNTSAPISTTLRIDRNAPSTEDTDGYRLSYTRIITDEVGNNAQLVLGGALNDATSGRLQVEVKAGELGLWHTVSAVGDMPVPPGNEFTTTMTSLNWIYTPTFDVRGVYPLWGRGVDAAGNYEAEQLMGALWWEPDDVPVLDESRVSASPSPAYAGQVVAFTVGARNTGYQEAQMLITDTLPAGLTLVPGSISDGGQYDAGTRSITWTLYALWPGQTRYLHFEAQADALTGTLPVTLTNQVEMLAYWPWLNLPGVPAAPPSHAYTTDNTLVVLPGSAPQDAAAPRILSAAVEEGSMVDVPQVTLLVNTTPQASFLYVKEWVWNTAQADWEPVAASGWVPFTNAPGFGVSEDGAGKYGRYTWTLSTGDGVKYLSLWVADADGQVSNVNEGNMLYTNRVSSGGQSLPAGESVQYRVPLQPGALALFSLISLSGDADLYVWAPRAGFMPNYYSNAEGTDGGLSIDTVGFYAPEEGMYVVEVHAASDAYYRLVAAGDLTGTGLLAATQVDPARATLAAGDLDALAAQDALLLNVLDTRQALPQGTHLAMADKARPGHPSDLSTPFGLGELSLLPMAPEVPYVTYLPLIFKR